jgi:hypothetical protein
MDPRREESGEPAVQMSAEARDGAYAVTVGRDYHYYSGSGRSRWWRRAAGRVRRKHAIAVAIAVMVAVPVIVVVTAGTWPDRKAGEAAGAWASHSPGPPAAGCARNVPLHRVSALVGTECIGYSDDVALTFGTGKALPAAQHRIFRYNREVERLVAGGWRNPRVRLIVMTALTAKRSLPEDERYPAEREAMEGIAVAQDQALQDAKQTASRPLLEVVVANAGQEGDQAETLVPEIGRLVEADPTVVGVLVAMDSRTSTRKAMQQLQARGLLVMTSTGAAERLREGMTRFLQLQSTTREQSRLVRAYAKQLDRDAIVNIYTSSDRPPGPQNADLYVDDLRSGLRQEFGGGYEEGRWGDATLDLRARCHDRYDGIVFYGGRYTSFHGFLKELYTTCGRKNLPILVAAGNTARYVVGDPASNGRNGAPSDFPLVFSSNGVASASCDPENPTARQKLFLDAVVKVLRQCRDPADPRPLGVRMGPAFDLITIFLDAAADLAGGGAGKFTGAGIHARILERNRREPFSGVGGPIHFGDNGVIDSGGESLMCARNVQAAYTKKRSRQTTPYEIASTGAGGVPTTGKDFCPLPWR